MQSTVTYPTEHVKLVADITNLCGMHVTAVKTVFRLRCPINVLRQSIFRTHAVTQIANIARNARAVLRVEQIPTIAYLFQLRTLGIALACKGKNFCIFRRVTSLAIGNIQCKSFVAVGVLRRVVVDYHTVALVGILVVVNIGVTSASNALAEVNAVSVGQHPVVIGVGFCSLLPLQQIRTHGATCVVAFAVRGTIYAVFVLVHVKSKVQVLFRRIDCADVYRLVGKVYKIRTCRSQRLKLLRKLVLCQPRCKIVHIQLAVFLVVIRVNVAVVTIRRRMQQLLLGKSVIYGGVCVYGTIATHGKGNPVAHCQSNNLLEVATDCVRGFALCHCFAVYAQCIYCRRSADKPYSTTNLRFACHWRDKHTHCRNTVYRRHPASVQCRIAVFPHTVG